ncbi:hypothetical protein C4D60_Mb01t00110 [Musa balbisiana]|uniref:TF-B3 domain-containing protein n=1 Tax=Musa balbisiana TaxID=52838 RepID=A0A4S8JJ01_MUSBA|nr:hypothetical protein C4D60_Mb01t00110 [Musa balbisiana]
MAGMSKLEASVASSRSSTLDAAEHRATRRRKMVAKQRGRRARRRPASDADAASQAVDGLRFLLQKELRNSDVSQLGRIVLPKKEAEAHLPSLTSRDGIAINMDDLENLQVWTFKYRFWPNNRSRMYILENTDEGIFDSILPDIVVGSVRYSDLFLPLAEGMNVAYGYGLSYAFEEDFPMTFPDGSTGS